VLAHQELPFARMVVELAGLTAWPPAAGSVMFAATWRVVGRPTGRAGVAPGAGGERHRQVQLELTVTDAVAGPQVRVNYNRDPFDPATGCPGPRPAIPRSRDNPDLAVADAEIVARSSPSSRAPGSGAVDDPAATALGRLSRPAGRLGPRHRHRHQLTATGRVRWRRITAAVRKPASGR
jgi:hypothetical protein